MKKSILLPLFFLLLFSAAACGGKKQFAFTGRETEEQAFTKCVHLSVKKKFQESIECLEIFKSRFPDSRYAVEAELKIGDAYYSKKEYLLAAESYQLFAKLHPTSDKLDYVYYRIGLSYFHETPEAIDRDQAYVPQSSENFELVLKQFPSSPYAKMARLKYNESRLLVAKRHFYIGRLYYKWGEYKAAIPRFKEVYEKYANLGLDEDALYYTVLAYYELDKLEDAETVFEFLKAKFPESKKTQKIAQKFLKAKESQKEEPHGKTS